MSPTRRAYLEMHFVVILYGFTAILGDLIQLPATILVWWRVFITSVSLLFFIQFGKTLLTIPKPLILKYMGIGMLIALHWITFFGAVKYSNVSVTLVCFALSAFITSLLEPLFTDRKFERHEMLLGLFVVPGMALVVQGLDFSLLTGVVLGILSALLAALFSILNKKLVNDADPLSITFLELGSGCLFITLLLPAFFYYNPTLSFFPTGMDWVYLLILALVCTTLAYVLNLRALKHLSAFTTNLIINLEPVYGIFLAIVLLQENKELAPSFYVGVLIILLSILAHPFLKRRKGI